MRSNEDEVQARAGESQAVRQAQTQAAVKQLASELEGMQKKLQLLQQTEATQAQAQKKAKEDEEEVEVADQTVPAKPEQFDEDPTRFGMYNMDEGHAAILDKNQASALLQHQKQAAQAAGSDAQEGEDDSSNNDADE